MSDEDAGRSLFKSGLEALDRGDFAAGESYFTETLTFLPNSVPTLSNLLLCKFQQRKFDELIELANRILALDGNNIEALHAIATSHKECSRYKLALNAYDEILSRDARNIQALNNRGVILNNLRRYEEAIESLNRALALDPRMVDALVNRGNAERSLKKFNDAASSFGAALSIKPDLESAWVGRGNVLYEIKHYDEALAAYNKALSIKPDLQGAWLGRGNVLCELKHYDEALAAYDRALSIRSDLESAWLGRGTVFHDLRRYDEAIAAYDKALSIKPDLEGAWIGRGNAFYAQNCDAEALACYDKAIESKPDLPEGHWAKALVKLKLGDYEEGWRLYETRWKTKDFTSPKRNFAGPLWLNNFDIKGKTLLVYWEQGFGDTIQYCRYVDGLRATGANIVFEVQKPLFSLIRSQNWDCDVIAYGDAIPPFDAHCPLMSLPLAFGTRLDSIPDKVPYLFSAGPRSSDLDIRSASRSDALRIGLVWSGNPGQQNDFRRSIKLQDIVPLLEADCAWFAIQKDVRSDDQAFMKSNNRIADLSQRISTFEDTASIIESLDLVISVDTSVAHLAGAMGKPVWILLPVHHDFRWPTDRTDSPWYPTARLYRQTQDGQWSDVLELVSRDLKALSSARAHFPK